MILHEAELVYEIVSVQVNYDASYTSKDHLPLVLVILPVLLLLILQIVAKFSLCGHRNLVLHSQR